MFQAGMAGVGDTTVQASFSILCVPYSIRVIDFPGS